MARIEDPYKYARSDRGQERAEAFRTDHDLPEPIAACYFCSGEMGSHRGNCPGRPRKIGGE